jgi:hypothetical protein
MIKILEFFYYCFYCIVRKRLGDSSPRRASFGLFFSLSLTTVSLIFFAIVIFRFQLPNKWIFIFSIMLLVVLIGKLISPFLIDSGRYIEIVERYNANSDSRKNFYAIIALTIYISSLVCFIVGSMYLNDYAKAIISGN